MLLGAILLLVASCIAIDFFSTAVAMWRGRVGASGKGSIARKPALSPRIISSIVWSAVVVEEGLGNGIVDGIGWFHFFHLLPATT